jgi:formylglycine-generating enzyme required for sulfatase activity
MKSQFATSLIFQWAFVMAAQATIPVQIPGASIEIRAGENFAAIKAGKFMMGTKTPPDAALSGGDESYHEVRITKDFQMQKTEVTQAQYFQVMKKNPSYFSKKEFCPETHKVVQEIGMCPDYPVEMVDWNDTQKFLKILNQQSGEWKYRLPTEAEWEFAARAGTTTSHWFAETANGATWTDTDNIAPYAWYAFNRIRPIIRTQTVATKPANPWGLHDVSGNVQEWVQDSYQDLTEAKAQDPLMTNHTEYKGFRGGSVFTSAVNIRSSVRNYGPARVKDRDIGFRLVRVKK